MTMTKQQSYELCDKALNATRDQIFVTPISSPLHALCLVTSAAISECGGLLTNLN